MCLETGYCYSSVQDSRTDRRGPTMGVYDLRTAVEYAASVALCAYSRLLPTSSASAFLLLT